MLAEFKRSKEAFMVPSQQSRGSVFRVALAIGAVLTPALAMAQAAPLDPYAPAPPAPPPIVAPPAAQPAPPPPPPAPPASSNSGTINNNNNTNTVSPTITANPTNNNSNTSNNTNTNDNRSSATATNNNTIYIYPPAYPPPAPPPVVAPPTALTPPRLVPPPLVPAPYAPLYQPQRIRLNCRQLCGPPPLRPIPIASPLRERIRYVSIGTHVTALGMAHQPLAGWGTLYGGGFQVTVRSRGRFGFEMSQDFLRGQLRSSNDGNSITRNSFPIDFTFRGYILPNLDRYHFNMYFGAGFGAIASSLEIPAQFGTASQSFLEWTIHADLGAELRFKWIALGLDSKVMGLVRDGNFGDARFYGGVQDGPVPGKTWGLQGRGYLSFWF